jgi:hypothetical protein
MAAKCSPLAGGNAPRISGVMSRSTLTVATAYRKTCPHICKVRCAVSMVTRSSIRLRQPKMSLGKMPDMGLLPSQGKIFRPSIRLERLFFSAHVSTFFDPHSLAMTSKLFVTLFALDCLTAFLFSPGSTPWVINFRAASRLVLESFRLVSG